jgi:hypothetical protein
LGGYNAPNIRTSKGGYTSMEPAPKKEMPVKEQS